MTTAAPLACGSRLGNFELLTEIGRGGMASVWVARDHARAGALVAVKAMLPQLARNPDFRGMFLDEGRLARSIEHDNVVKVYDVAEDQGVLFMAMEWIDGDSLRAVVREAQGRPLAGDIAARVVANVAAGLHAAHELRGIDGSLRQLVHCDVSPHNVLISTTGTVKLVDFGVANAAGHLSEADTGRVRGKFGYMSPEQTLGEKLDRRSDVFSLAIVLFELSAGQRLFQGRTARETIELVQRGQVPRPSALVAGYPAALEAVLLRGLERDRERRFQTAAEFATALHEFLRLSGTVVPNAAIAGLLRRVLRERLDGRRAAIRRAVAVLDGAEPPSESSTAPGVAVETDGRTVTNSLGGLSGTGWSLPNQGAAYLPDATATGRGSFGPPSSARGSATPMPPRTASATAPASSVEPRATLSSAAEAASTTPAAAPLATTPRRRRLKTALGIAGVLALGGVAAALGLALSRASVPAPTERLSEASTEPASAAEPPATARPEPAAATPAASAEVASAEASGTGHGAPPPPPEEAPLELSDLAVGDAGAVDGRAAERRPAGLRSTPGRATAPRDADEPSETVSAGVRARAPEGQEAPLRTSPTEPVEHRKAPDVSTRNAEARPEDDAGAPVQGTAPLNRGAALAALGKAAGAGPRCRRGDGPFGTGQATVTFAPSGRVSSASVSEPFAGTSAGQCVVEAFREARIPAFRGSPVTLKRSFVVPK